MKKVIQWIDTLTDGVGRLADWAVVFLVVVVCFDVFIRYVFRWSYVWLTELEMYVFGLVILFALGYALKHGKHVRVDVFYAKLSDKGKAWIDILGGFLFFLVWMIVVMQVAWKYAYRSFLLREHSSQPGGLPIVYVLKMFLVIGFGLLMLQGVSEVLKSVRILQNKKD